MRANIESMYNFSIMAVDGEIGEVKNFYFDDHTMTLRYLVVKTGGWLLGKKVLIAFASVTGVDMENGTFSVNLTCDQVRNSPDIDTEKPVCKQHEMELHDYYMLPIYWLDAPGVIWNVNDYTVPEIREVPTEEDEKKDVEQEEKGDHHLRSSKQVTGYLIHAKDGEIGHVKDFLIDTGSWQICSLVVDTRNLLAGRKILIEPDKVERIEWLDSEVYVKLTRQEIIESPEFDIDQDL